MITDEQYDRLYQMGGKFKDLSDCMKCDVCRSRPWVYMYPGEATYRQRMKLLPRFTMRESKVVDGDVLMRCPVVDEKAHVKHCTASPLVCRMSPIQVFKHPGGRAEVRFVHASDAPIICPKELFDREWVEELVNLIVELYVNLRVGE